MAALNPKSKAILEKLLEKYDIDGLDSLLEITPDGVHEFTVALYKKGEARNAAIPVAIISGNAGYGELDIAHLSRDKSNNSTKGTGRLLLELVASRAADLGLTLTLIAIPKRNNKNNMRLYNFYNSVGLNRLGEEVRIKQENGRLNRWQKYHTTANKLRERFTGGRKHTKRRRY
jgi:hypothetical protein